MTDRQRQVIEDLFRAYGPGVGRYILSRAGDVQEAEAITSRIFGRVVDRIGQCNGSPIGWLWAIVRSEVALHFRTRRGEEAIADEHFDPNPGPAEQVENREMQSRLHWALEQLEEVQRRLLEMKFFLQLPNVEIARAMNLTASNVGVMVHRAIKQLKGLMEADVEERVDATGTRNART